MSNEDFAAQVAINAVRRAGATAREPERMSPWIINLRAAMTSLRAAVGPLPGLEHLCVYEIARVEDGRPRHRLRVGFFADQAGAESALAAIRRTYPAAFAAPATRDDLMHLGDFQLPVTRATSTGLDLADNAVLTLLERDARVQPPAPDAPDALNVSQTHVELNLVPELPETAEPAPQADGHARPTAQTEADWFALELVTSDRPPTPGSLRQLDIFAAYSLYPTVVTHGTRTFHAIRLGFFRERVSAAQVASYVRCAYPDVDIVGVTAGEHERHAGRRTAAALAIDCVELQAPDSNIIELTRARGGAAAISNAIPARESAKQGPIARPQSAASPDGRVSGANDTSRSGRHKTLGELLIEEARQVALSETAIRRMPAHKKTLFNKLVGRLKR